MQRIEQTGCQECDPNAPKEVRELPGGFCFGSLFVFGKCPKSGGGCKKNGMDSRTSYTILTAPFCNIDIIELPHQGSAHGNKTTFSQRLVPDAHSSQTLYSRFPQLPQVSVFPNIQEEAFHLGRIRAPSQLRTGTNPNSPKQVGKAPKIEG